MELKWEKRGEHAIIASLSLDWMYVEFYITKNAVSGKYQCESGNGEERCNELGPFDTLEQAKKAMEDEWAKMQQQIAGVTWAKDSQSGNAITPAAL